MIRGRRLNANERAVAQRVFCCSIPLDDIYLVDILGLGGRPFTIPGEVALLTLAAARVAPGLGPLVGLAAAAGPVGFAVVEGIRWLSGELTLAAALGDYLVCMGRAAYNGDAAQFRFGTDSRAGATFIHELTHVWQGEHSSVNWAYVIDSLWSQATSSNAYAYTAGQGWTSYNVEQQAEIVEDWYANGEQLTDPLYRYLTQNIRICSSGSGGQTAALQRAGGNPRNIREK